MDNILILTCKNESSDFEQENIGNLHLDIFFCKIWLHEGISCIKNDFIKIEQDIIVSLL